MDPRGWIWRDFNFQHNLLKQVCVVFDILSCSYLFSYCVTFTQYMLHVADIRDCLDTERFVQVHFDPATEDRKDRTHSVKTSEISQGVGDFFVLFLEVLIFQ